MANVKTGVASTTTKTPAKTAGLKGLLMSMQGQIAKALPSVLTPERYTRMVMTALSTNPKLQQCTPESFLGAVMQAAQLGLEPNTPLGQAYLIPRKNKGQLQVVFQIGYQGYLDLGYRSGDIAIIDAQTVHERDFFEYEYGLEPKLKFIPALADRGPVIAYYAMFKTKAGGYNFLVMSKEDVERHKDKYVDNYDSGYSPWNTNFDSMAKKTVLKQVLKYAPKKSEFAKALAADETIKTSISANMAEVADETEPINVTPTVETEPVNTEVEPPDEIVPFDAD